MRPPSASVPTSASGHFRFFAKDGEWTLRTLAPKADPVDRAVRAQVGLDASVTDEAPEPVAEHA